jgi:hypothetical protein
MKYVSGSLLESGLENGFGEAESSGAELGGGRANESSGCCRACCY